MAIKNDLLVFKFQEGENPIIICEQLQAFDKSEYPIYCQNSKSLPFLLKMLKSSIGNNCDFILSIVRADTNAIVFSKQHNLLDYDLFEDETYYYFVFNPIVFDNVLVSCTDYFMRIVFGANVLMLTSILFVPISNIDSLAKFELGNNIDLLDCAYSTGFKQVFYLPNRFFHSEVKTFEDVKKDDFGNEKLIYRKITESRVAEYQNIHSIFYEVLSSFSMYDSIKVTAKGKVYEAISGNISTANIKQADKENTYNITLSIPYKVIEYSGCIESNLIKNKIPNNCPPADKIILGEVIC